MAIYNAIIKKRNAANTEFDTILPVTIAENVMISEDYSLAELLPTLGGGLSATQTTFTSTTITETYSDNSVLVTTFNEDGTITEVYTKDLVVTTKTTTFNADGSITEVMS